MCVCVCVCVCACACVCVCVLRAGHAVTSLHVMLYTVSCVIKSNFHAVGVLIRLVTLKTLFSSGDTR